MKIAIDISSVIYGTGVSMYTQNLVRNLLVLDRENKYLLFGGSLRRRTELVRFADSLSGNYATKVYFFPPSAAHFVWNKLHLLRIEKLIGEVDIYHSSDWAQAPSRACKITTVHDLSALRFPKLTHPKIVAANELRIKWVKKEVDRVIVPSEATREDLILLKVNKNRIVVIPEAADPQFKRASKSEIDRLKSRKKIKSDYLLAVGVGPRKNTSRIIEAFFLSSPAKTMKLVIVGHDHFGYKKREGVIFLGHVPNKELSVLYSGAKALLYPSLYEGFGLPILDAFSCECPVVTSNLSSMPEVAGEAAVLVDPYNLESIAEGIEKTLKRRKSLIQKGKKQEKKFSWKRTAKDTLNVYYSFKKGNY